jgi:tetratricopeptide (TPR) repeat protein
VAAAAPDLQAIEGAKPYSQLVAEGNRLLKRGRSKEAASAFARALVQNNTGAEALTGLGFCALDQGQIPRAVSFFQQAARSDGGHRSAWFGLGEAYREGGKLREALAAFRRSVAGGATGPEAVAATHQIQDLERRLAQR